MNRAPFYNVSPGTYLFPETLRTSDTRKNPEEPVRQWCAFELMRAYGISINQMVIEHKVRVGSKTYGIDILILQNGIPWAVIECKKQDHEKHSEAMDQAISYAIAEGIQASFAVYTNGTVWHVQRRVAGRWVSVPDLPRGDADHRSEPLTELLRAQEAVAPILYALDEELEKDDARKFLEVLQSFFIGRCLLLDDIHPALITATDNMLRVLCMPHESAQYRFGKLATAAQHFEQYRLFFRSAATQF